MNLSFTTTPPKCSSGHAQCLFDTFFDSFFASRLKLYWSTTGNDTQDILQLKMSPWTPWVQSRQPRKINRTKVSGFFAFNVQKWQNVFLQTITFLLKKILCILGMDFWHPHWFVLTKTPENSCSISGIDNFFEKSVYFSSNCSSGRTKCSSGSLAGKKLKKNSNFFALISKNTENFSL